MPRFGWESVGLDGSPPVRTFSRLSRAATTPRYFINARGAWTPSCVSAECALDRPRSPSALRLLHDMPGLDRTLGALSPPGSTLS
eukprot:3798909-Alexandrium_andersonii.AAC.1